jgi:hypothetical protein
MPFREVASDFQPDELDRLTAAFNGAWQQLVVANGLDTELQIELLRQKLAQHIMACARSGQLDPDKLKDSALRALMKRDS